MSSSVLNHCSIDLRDDHSSSDDRVSAAAKVHEDFLLDSVSEEGIRNSFRDIINESSCRVGIWVDDSVLDFFKRVEWLSEERTTWPGSRNTNTDSGLFLKIGRIITVQSYCRTTKGYTS